MTEKANFRELNTSTSLITHPEPSASSPSRKILVALLSAVLFVVTPLVGFRDIFDGNASFFISYDNVEQFYPWYQKLSQAVHHGYLPLWDANVLSGHSFVGEFQTGVFYPLNIAWVGLLGTSGGINILALEWLVMFHFVAASIFAFLLARRLQLSVIASTVVGLLYGYTGDFAHRASGQTCIFFGNTFLPLVILFIVVCLETRRLRYAFFGGAVIGVQVLTGHLQPPSISGLVAVSMLIAAAVERKSFGFSLKASIALIVSAVIFGAPQLFFGFQYLSHAYRWVSSNIGPINGTARLPVSDFLATAFTPRQLLNVLDPRSFDAPDGNILFIGCLPLVVIAFAFAMRSSRIVVSQQIRKKRTFWFLAIFGVLMLSGPLTPVAAIVYHVPFAPAAVRELGRYAILVQLAMILTVGFAIDALGAPSNRASIARQLPLVAAFLTGSLLYAAYINKTLTDGGLIAGVVLFGIGLLVFSTAQTRSLLLSVLIAAEISIELPAMAKSTAAETYPPKRFANIALLKPAEDCFPLCRLAILDDVVPANIGDVYPVQTIYGKGATMYEPYFDLLGGGGFDPHGFVEDALNVRYIIAGHKLDGFTLRGKLSEPDRYLYERPNAFPRVFNLEALQKRQSALNDVKFAIVSYDDLAEVIDVNAPRHEMVVFSELFYPGWVVSVDGRSEQMFSVGIQGSAPVLRAVNLAAGTHRVRFDYPRFSLE